MSLSPIDVAQQQFRRTVGGYRPDEVESFLKAVAHAMTGLIKRNTELQAQQTSLQQRLDALERRENDVKEALVLAQRAVDEVRGQADKEAQLRREQAELEAQQIVADAQGRQISLSAQIKELTRQRARFVEELRGLVSTHARLLDLHLADAPTAGAPGHRDPRSEAAGGSNDVFDVLQAPAPPDVGGPRGKARPPRGGRHAAARETSA